MELQAVAGQLHIVNGQTQSVSNVPGLLTQSAPSKATRGRDRDFLFVHLALSGPVEETSIMIQDLQDAISNTFYKSSGSVTAALRKAILDCNQLLLGHNLGGAVTAREGAVTCAVLRNDELYVAQAGETFAFLGHNFGIERLPPSRPSKNTPLGRSAGLDIRFYHNWLQSGDMLLLSGPRLAHLPTEDFDPVLIDSDVEDGLQELTRIISQDSARVILVEFTDEAPGYLPDANRSANVQISGQQLSPPSRQPLRESDTLNTSAGNDGSSVSMPDIDVEAVETSARKATSRAAFGLSRLTAWLADLLGKIRSPGEREEPSQGWAIPTLLAIAIPLVLALVVTGVYVQRGSAIQVGEIKGEIANVLYLAQQASNGAEAEQYYHEALNLLLDAEKMRPGDDSLASLREQALIGLDGVAGVTRLKSQLLQQFKQEINLTSVALGEGLSGGLYALDSSENRVYHLQTDENLSEVPSSDPEPVIVDQQVVGSHIVGQMKDMIWRPSGNQVTRDGLATLDLRGALLSYFPNYGDTRAVPLALSSDWVQPTAITTFNERLYVLDPGAPTIWRYFADGEGFSMNDDQRTIDFIEDADLGSVVDIAIYSEDGSVILLYNDGRLRRYVNGRLLWSEQGLSDGGLESPLVAPVALKIVGRGLNSSLFVLDPGSDRVVQFSLGGTFLAQFKASDNFGQELFRRGADVAVAENPLRIFVTADNEIYMTTLE